ncbi:MAG TPA: biotin--[acetyl-CoA-carboxylase] ligase [Solirubrobacteraceae bacterium]|nr:biotin--[acetyl-CoA-carboxylase] ligase [Solirubrobacteraceae bacterium]
MSAQAAAAGLGHPRLHLRRTDSTNDRARTLALRGAPHGTVVTAAEQTAGRGRQGRTWSAPAGQSLLCSTVWRPVPLLLPLIAGVAVARVTGGQIKWPNDVVFVEQDRRLRKLAGILAEGRPQEGWAVLGIGVNVAVQLDQMPDELRERAATLGRTRRDIEPVLAQLMAALSHWATCPDSEVLDAWRERDALRGREIHWATGDGRADGIDGDGRLIVRRPDGGQVTLDAGEVHLGAV